MYDTHERGARVGMFYAVVRVLRFFALRCTR